MKKIIVAGVGPGNPNYLTLEVERIIKSDKKICAFKRVKETLSSLNSNICEIKTRADIMEFQREHGEIVVLASGDPAFYGIGLYLKNQGYEIESLPGISSVSYFANKINKELNYVQFISLHGRDDFKVEKRELIFLTDNKNTPSKISKRLYNAGFRGEFTAGYNLSYEDEKIIMARIGEEIEEPSSLAVVYVDIDESN